MENKKDLKIAVDEFLEEVQDQSEKETDIKCDSEECRMKNKDGIIERIEKKYVTNDGRILLQD